MIYQPKDSQIYSKWEHGVQVMLSWINLECLLIFLKLFVLLLSVMGRT
jgi:hypothetical protein